MDIRIEWEDFKSTSVFIEAVSEKAKDFFSQFFGAGAVSATLPKSKAGDFLEFCERKGFRLTGGQSVPTFR